MVHVGAKTSDEGISEYFEFVGVGICGLEADELAAHHCLRKGSSSLPDLHAGIIFC